MKQPQDASDGQAGAKDSGASQNATHFAQATPQLPISERLLVRPEEAAALLGVGRSTIYELMRSGELPVIHIGRAARIPLHDLQRWVETHAR